MKQYEIGKATVRIHPGKRTEEERRVAIEGAAVRFLKEVHRKKKQKVSVADGSSEVDQDRH